MFKLNEVICQSNSEIFAGRISSLHCLWRWRYWALVSVPPLFTVVRLGVWEHQRLLKQRFVRGWSRHYWSEIVYVESEERPLEIRIVKQQMKFCTAIEEITNSDTEHYITRLVNNGESTDVLIISSTTEIWKTLTQMLKVAMIYWRETSYIAREKR